MDLEPDYPHLLEAKARALSELNRRKPGQKGYKRRLRAFLDADAAAQKALLAKIELQLDPTLESPAAPREEVVPPR